MASRKTLRLAGFVDDPRGRMSDIFLSYSREDIRAAELLAKALEQAGWSVWWDRRVAAGQDFAELIERELTGAKCVIVLWSASSIESKWVRSEATEADNRGILVPATLNPAVQIPLLFRRLQVADLSGWNGSSADPRFAALATDVAEKASLAKPVSSSSVAQGPVGDSQRRRRMSLVAGIVGLGLIIVLGNGLWRSYTRGAATHDSGSTAPAQSAISPAAPASGPAQDKNRVSAAQPPAVVSDGKSVYFFVTDPVGNVYFNTAVFGQAFKGWRRVANNVAAMSAPSAGAVGTYLYIVMRGKDGQVYLNQGGGEAFNTWASMGLTTDAGPSVVGVADNVYFFARTRDGKVHYNWSVTNQAGAGWAQVPGDPGAASSPSAGAVDGQVFVAVTGVGGDVIYNQAPARGSFNQSWLSMKFETDAAPALVGAGGSIYVFARSAQSGGIYYTSAVLGQGFIGWKAMKPGVRAASAPAVGAIGKYLFVAFIGVDRKLYYNQGDAGSDFGDWFPMELPRS
jgi:hypothetical protein